MDPGGSITLYIGWQHFVVFSSRHRADPQSTRMTEQVAPARCRKYPAAGAQLEMRRDHMRAHKQSFQMCLRFHAPIHKPSGTPPLIENADSRGASRVLEMM